MNAFEDQNSAGFGYACIKTGVVGCFSRCDLTVELKFSEAGEVAVNFVRDEIMQTVFIERAEAEKFLSSILAAAHKPEVLSGSRSTTWHYAEARWKNLASIEGGRLGEINTKFNEFSTEEIEDFLPHIEDETELRKARQLLAKGLHRRAIEIYREVESFAASRSYLYRNL